MTPFGKIIFSLIGFKIWGFSGFLWGMFLGHVLIDRSILNQIIKRKLNRLEDTIRLVLPYRFYPVLDFIDRLFDNRFFKKFKHKFDIFWDRNLIKILGVTIGFSLDSKVLIFTGVIIGFFIDSYTLDRGLKNKTISKFWRKINPLKLALNSKEARQVAFTQSIASIAAKICSTDGKISEHEINVFNKLFNVSNTENTHLSYIFFEAQKTPKDFERHAYQIKLLTENNLDLKESAIENLFKFAIAEGNIMQEKIDILREVSDIIELPIGNFEIIKDCFEPSSQTCCYQILGVTFNASNDEVKKRWKDLITQYHPDKIQASGGSPEEIKAAGLKMARINNAYQQIMKKRKL